MEPDLARLRAVGLTCYMTAQTLVLNYVRTPAHFEALWFASIANNILWWTFVKACTRTLVGLFGAPPLPFWFSWSGQLHCTPCAAPEWRAPLPVCMHAACSGPWSPTGHRTSLCIPLHLEKCPAMGYRGCVKGHRSWVRSADD